MIAVATAPPAPTGGVIANGTYHLTSMVEYTGVGGSTTPSQSTWYAYTVVVTQSSAKSARVQFGITYGSTLATTSYDFDSAGTMNLSGATYRLDVICPAAASGTTGGYSADATSFSIITTSADGTSQMGRFARVSALTSG
jgi:hypothetical protein